MKVTRLWLTDFRNYTSAELSPAPDGMTVLVGANGQGKTNLLEAVSWLATLESFRGAPGEALVRHGASRAVIRAEADRDGRALLVEAELAVAGQDRAQVNRQPLRRTRDLLGAIRVSLFSPDDLALVKGSPGERRRFIDLALVALSPRHDQLRGDLERILRQRASLLKASGSRPGTGLLASLDVWDAKLTEVGEAVVDARARLVGALTPLVAGAYEDLAGRSVPVTLSYQRSWEGDLAEALSASRTDDLRRGITTVGPHRDDLVLGLGGLPSRHHASQGEARSLALALRLAVHRAVAEEVGSSPVLLLDDVFSELDTDRGAALLAHLPAGQCLLTTTGEIPFEAQPDLVIRVDGGRLAAFEK